jgi:hypothetical protein
MAQYDFELALARELLSWGMTDVDLDLYPAPEKLQIAATLAANLGIPFPPGLAPVPQPINPAPNPSAPLPKADVLVVTWTVDEVSALADVLTPGFTKDHWYRYSRNFAQYDPLIRRGAPAKVAQRLGSYFPSKIGNKSVLSFKSELHLNQDSMETPPGSPGNATLPVKDLFHQLIDEVQPKVFLTTGTAGGVYADQDLGDVAVTRGAKFRVKQEFRNAPFKDGVYSSDWDLPETQFAAATQLMAKFKDKLSPPDELLPPTLSYTTPTGGYPKPSRPDIPDIWLDGQKVNGKVRMPKFHPILTTDYFEFGTSKNHLDAEGCAVEMGDAVLGLCIEERKNSGRSTPFWAVVRNCSDPQINGDLKDLPKSQSLQVMWAVYYYKGYGYWTTVMSALACWGIIAGL